jgi:transcriptional pleiotropic regulator of transition state genes
MKATGVTRAVDPLGRVCIPIELRRTFDINIGDSMEIFTNDEGIFIRKYNPGCVLCGSLENVHTVDGVKICKKCAEKIAKAVK